MQFVLDLVLNNLDVIISFALGLGILAPFVLKGKTVIKELTELFVAVNDALKDDKLSKEEIASIVKEAGDVIGIFKKKNVN